MTSDLGPQTENGFTPFANELLEAILLAGFSKQELMVLLAVARNTYGWSRKHYQCSASWLSVATGLRRSHCVEARVTLLNRGVLKRDQHNTQLIGINKHYKQWQGVPKRDRGPETGLEGVPKRDKKGSRNGTQENKDKTRINQVGVFHPPTLEEAEAFAKAEGFTLDVAEWLSYWQGQGWKRRGGPIKDWKATMRNAAIRFGGVPIPPPPYWAPNTRDQQKHWPAEYTAVMADITGFWDWTKAETRQGHLIQSNEGISGADKNWQRKWTQARAYYEKKQAEAERVMAENADRVMEEINGQG